nr:unnamed protein product [Digitaria exilis]
MVLLSGSWTCRPAAAARPLLGDDEGRRIEQAPASADSVIVLMPSAIWRLWDERPLLQMKQAGPGLSCKGSTWDPNNGCPTPPTNP